MNAEPGYRGRFAPSPTGPLHFGSLVSALASFLDARAHRGTWLIRIEDVDGPRTVPGAAAEILETLGRFGMFSAEEPVWQSQREVAYQQAFEQLLAAGFVFPCGCTRREIADSLAWHGHTRHTLDTPRWLIPVRAATGCMENHRARGGCAFQMATPPF
jgi:glutamyl-Q tRNA(Asp) synthetase